ncbi:MAG TPA: LuxR C-terminal-related transcriptional regulator [Actinokineospora sp.]|nr:LuxR C-terminal-related transcriptional regulator [Actinokineospora sp.]
MPAVLRGPYLSAFIGREDELGEVRRLVDRNRLVTLLGPGGMGKSRLGYRVLGDMAPAFPGSAWSVDLADLVEPALLGLTVATSLGFRPPADEFDIGALAEQLGERAALVYVDNCEHLLDACAGLTAALLARCPGLRVLTSSRQALGVLGERVYPVPVMSATDAIELFANRATAALPSWTLERDRGAVVDLCQVLDRMPLAIELAAVRIRTFSPKAMAGRLVRDGALLSDTLRGEPSRRTSLVGCLQWSFDLCTIQEQLLWTRLSVFVGGFALEAVEAVCPGDGLAESDVVAALTGLVDKSLVERDVDDPEGRYRMLEVIRQFGGEKLGAAKERWRRRHRDYYLALAERFDAEWIGPSQREWMDRCRRERANLRLAFDFSVTAADEAPLAMRMCTVLEHFFASTGGGAEAVHWLQLALAHGTGTDKERAFALRVGCFVSALNAAMATASAMYDELTSLAEKTDDDWIRAYTLYAGAVLRTWQGDAETGAQLAADGLEILHRLGDVGRAANLHFLRGMMLGWADRADDAAADYQRCLELTEPRGERWLTSYAQWGLGVDALQSGESERAIRLERTALRAKVDLGDQMGIGLTVEALAWAAVDQRRGKDAAVLLGAAEAVWQEIGTSVAAMPYLTRRRDTAIRETRRLLSSAEFEDLVRHGRNLPQQDAIAIALGRTRVGRTGSDAALTRREREIAALLATGESNAAIAESLVISVRTVETHVVNIMRKLGLKSRSQVAAALAAEPSAAQTQ